jgi:hypothetical protein
MSGDAWMPRMIGAGLIMSLLAGCGGRDARPVTATNTADVALDCAAVGREFQANERQIVATLQEKDGAVAKNAILGVTGVVLFFPALFFMDPKLPEKVEIDALRNRNRVLEDIARSKRCTPPQTQVAEVYRRLDNMPEKAPNQ